MGILLRVAPVAGFVFDGCFHIVGVALLTRHFLVGAIERKTGLGVIETAGFP